MSAQTHAVPAGQLPQPGRCVWRWHSDGVDLRCTERIIPGGDLCPDHLIEKQRRLHP